MDPPSLGPCHRPHLRPPRNLLHRSPTRHQTHVLRPPRHRLHDRLPGLPRLVDGQIGPQRRSLRSWLPPSRLAIPSDRPPRRSLHRLSHNADLRPLHPPHKPHPLPPSLHCRNNSKSAPQPIPHPLQTRHHSPLRPRLRNSNVRRPRRRSRRRSHLQRIPIHGTRTDTTEIRAVRPVVLPLDTWS